MTRNPIRYGDLIRPDNSIKDLIIQLEQLGAVYDEKMKLVIADAVAAEKVLKKTNNTTKEGTEIVKKSSKEIEQLTASRNKLNASMTENAKKIALLKVKQQEQNNINKLTAKLNKAQVGSYDRLSALYSLIKIRLNKMTDSQRKNTKEGKKAEYQARKTYAQMEKMQQASGKFALGVGKYGRAINGLAGSLKTLAGTYLGLAGARRVFQNVTGTLIEFEKQMSSLQAISGATHDEFTLLIDDANELGRTTTKTATEVGSLQTAYAKLGFSTQEILDATAATIRLSEATGEDVTKSAETAGATIRGFALDAAETGRVVDVMAKSFTSSALNLDRFSESMKYVAPVARAAGLSVEKAAAALSIMADAGIHGSMAGTALRRILSEFDKAGKPFAENLRILAERNITLADASDEVGQRAQTALLVLSENTDKLAELGDEYDGAAGSAEAMAKIQRDNVAGALKLAASAWDGLVLKATGFKSLMREVADGTTEVIRWMTKNLGVIKNITKAVIIGLAAWSAYKLSVLATTWALKLNVGTTYASIVANGLFTTSMNLARTAMYSLNAAIIANPIGALVTIVATAATAFLLFADDINTTTKSQKELNEELYSTNELLGKSMFQAFLVSIGHVKRELITLPDGSRAMVNTFDDSIDVVDKLSKKIKDLKEEDLRNLRAYFSTLLLEAKRGLEDLEDSSIIKQTEIAKIQEYTGYIKVLQTELNRIYKLRETDDPNKNADPKLAGKIRDLRLSIVSDAEQKEFDTLRKSYGKKKLLFMEYGLDLVELDYWVANESAKIRKKYDDIEAKELKKKEDKAERESKKLIATRKKEALTIARDKKKASDLALKNINFEKAYALSSIDLMKKTEAEKTRLRIQAERDRLKKILEINKAGGLILTDIQIKTYKNLIKKLGETMDAAVSEEFDLYTMLGINLGSEKKEAITTSTQFAIGQVNEALAAQTAAANFNLAIADRQVEAAQSKLDAEIEARNNGYAFNVGAAQRDLDLARKTQQKALKEQQKAQRAQLIADSVLQASSLVTASAKIWGQLGFPWAIPAIAVMFGSFAFSKIKAFNVTKQKKEYGEGGLEFLDYGGSHASGNDIGIGTTKDGVDRRAERGEALAIVNKKSTSKYRGILPQIIDSLNKGIFEKKYGNSYSEGSLSLSVVRPKANLAILEGDVSEIKRQGERKFYTDGRGRTIELYKNLKRIHK